MTSLKINSGEGSMPLRSLATPPVKDVEFRPEVRLPRNAVYPSRTPCSLLSTRGGPGPKRHGDLPPGRSSRGGAGYVQRYAHDLAGKLKEVVIEVQGAAPLKVNIPGNRLNYTWVTTWNSGTVSDGS